VVPSNTNYIFQVTLYTMIYTPRPLSYFNVNLIFM